MDDQVYCFFTTSELSIVRALVIAVGHTTALTNAKIICHITYEDPLDNNGLYDLSGNFEILSKILCHPSSDIE